MPENVSHVSGDQIGRRIRKLRLLEEEPEGRSQWKRYVMEPRRSNYDEDAGNGGPGDERNYSRIEVRRDDARERRVRDDSSDEIRKMNKTDHRFVEHSSHHGGERINWIANTRSIPFAREKTTENEYGRESSEARLTRYETLPEQSRRYLMEELKDHSQSRRPEDVNEREYD